MNGWGKRGAAIILAAAMLMGTVYFTGALADDMDTLDAGDEPFLAEPAMDEIVVELWDEPSPDTAEDVLVESPSEPAGEVEAETMPNDDPCEYAAAMDDPLAIVTDAPDERVGRALLGGYADITDITVMDAYGNGVTELPTSLEYEIRASFLAIVPRTAQVPYVANGDALEFDSNITELFHPDNAEWSDLRFDVLDGNGEAIAVAGVDGATGTVTVTFNAAAEAPRTTFVRGEINIGPNLVPSEECARETGTPRNLTIGTREKGITFATAADSDAIVEMAGNTTVFTYTGEMVVPTGVDMNGKSYAALTALAGTLLIGMAITRAKGRRRAVSRKAREGLR